MRRVKTKPMKRRREEKASDRGSAGARVAGARAQGAGRRVQGRVQDVPMLRDMLAEVGGSGEEGEEGEWFLAGWGDLAEKL